MTRPVKPMSFARQPLDEILAGTGSVRVLRALDAVYGNALSVSRLAQDTRLTPDGVRGVLNGLERTGVVESLGSGRTRLFQIVRRHPMAQALNFLFDCERVRLDEFLAAALAEAADDRIVALWLFGSVARGEDTAQSDVDIALVVAAEPETVDTVADAFRAALRPHERAQAYAASVTAIPQSEIARLIAERSPLWSDLLRDAQILKGAAPERLAQQARSPRSPRPKERA